jgi:catechol 2,3-dioxygenase-like lactoylglutathione lyase family enzyme
LSLRERIGKALAPTALLAAFITAGVTPATAEETGMGIGPFREAVFSVADIEAASRVYREVAGWEEVCRGKASAEQARFWSLEPDQAIEEVVLRNPGDREGWLRLVRFPGAEQQVIRSNAQTWDTGGIFDVNVRVLDLERKFAQLEERHWQAYGDPVEFQFGPFRVKEVLPRGPDGVVFALIQRLEPPLEGWPNLRHFSHLFNSSQIVRDLDASLSFYVDKLGFEIYLEHEGASPEPGPNVLGLPHNIAAERPRRVVIVSPDGTNRGSVELLQFVGVTGRDFSDRAVPPNRGILMLRFPVSDLAAYHRQLVERGVSPVAGPADLMLEPYGRAKILAVRSPDGAWLEFMEVLAKREES